jgi:hypothetical protein
MEIAPVTGRWTDVAELFEPKGPRGGTSGEPPTVPAARGRHLSDLKREFGDQLESAALALRRFLSPRPSLLIMRAPGALARERVAVGRVARV